MLLIAQTAAIVRTRVKNVRIDRHSTPDIVREPTGRLQNPYGGCCFRLIFLGNRAIHFTKATADT
jgi:hypothetical protein